MDYHYTTNYEDVESGKFGYNHYIVGCALAKIAEVDKEYKDLTLDEVMDKLLSRYGGTCELAIIDYFRNT